MLNRSARMWQNVVSVVYHFRYAMPSILNLIPKPFEIKKYELKKKLIFN